jgi:hypothetical protein
MMKIKVNEKEYTIKFGYEPTLKSRLLSRVAKMSVSMKENAQDNMEQIENMLLFIPEMVLVGLQKFHADEFGYNLDTKEGYEEAKNKAFELVGNYVDNGEVDVTDFFTDLQEEMTSNGFLKKMFEREVQKEQAATPNSKQKAEN